jgi:hypothetical protein
MKLYLLVIKIVLVQVHLSIWVDIVNCNSTIKMVEIDVTTWGAYTYKEKWRNAKFVASCIALVHNIVVSDAC